MSYNLVMDAVGGSGVRAVIYDEKFNPVSFAKTGTLRDNSTSREKIDKHVRDALSQLFDGHSEIKELERVGGTINGDLLKGLKTRCSFDNVRWAGEPNLAMGGSNLTGSAIISLSGTGATTFYVKEGGHGGCFGALGAVVFDEGSGYYIGREACRAAILQDQGRGPNTLLYDLIIEFFNQKNFHDAIWSLYDTKRVISPITGVASLSPLVDKAADMGDKVALRILTNAGWARAEEANALIRSKEIPDAVPLTLAGGVWRGHPRYFESFVDVLDAGTVPRHPKRKIVIPQFEPVLGAMLLHYHELYGQMDEDTLKWFRDTYPQYIFKFRGKLPERR